MYDENNDIYTATEETVVCVMRISAKAGIKTQLYCSGSCIRKLENRWMLWKDRDKQKKNGKHDERREGFSRKIDSLWEIAAEGDVHQIMSNILLGKKEKKEDVKFH